MALSVEDKAKAVELKNQGNDAFKKHAWEAAIESYTKAIQLDDSEPTYFSNRAQVQLPQMRCGRAPVLLA